MTDDTIQKRQAHSLLFAPIMGVDKNGELRSIRIDDATRSMQFLNYEHHEVHAGNHYFYYDGITLENTASQQYMITTPDTTKWCHMIFAVSSGLSATVTLDEGGDRVGTTAQTTPNSDRNSDNTAGCVVHKGTSGGTTDGTEIANLAFGTASIGGKLGGGARSSEEIILKQNTKYLLTIVSGANSNNITVHMSFYEHTNSTGQ